MKREMDEGIAAAPCPRPAAGEGSLDHSGSRLHGQPCARLGRLIRFARRRGWRVLGDGKRLVLVSGRTGATIRVGLGVEPGR